MPYFWWLAELVETFYPFEYAGFHLTSWDVIIIEGWFPSITTFLHEARRVHRHKNIVILYWCLDPGEELSVLISRVVIAL